MFDWERDEKGMLQQVPADNAYDPDAVVEEEMEDEDQ